MYLLFALNNFGKFVFFRDQLLISTEKKEATKKTKRKREKKEATKTQNESEQKN